MKCKNCGLDIIEGSTICPNCGTEIFNDLSEMEIPSIFGDFEFKTIDLSNQNTENIQTKEEILPEQPIIEEKIEVVKEPIIINISEELNENDNNQIKEANSTINNAFEEEPKLVKSEQVIDLKEKKSEIETDVNVQNKSSISQEKVVVKKTKKLYEIINNIKIFLYDKKILNFFPLLLGIISIILSFVIGILAVIIASTGLIISIIAKNQKNIINIVINLIAIFIIIIMFIVSNSSSQEFSIYGKYDCSMINAENGEYITSLYLNKNKSFIYGKYNDLNNNSIKGTFTYEKENKVNANKDFEYYMLTFNKKIDEKNYNDINDVKVKMEMALGKNDNQKIAIIIFTSTYNMYYCYAR